MYFKIGLIQTKTFTVSSYNLNTSIKDMWEAKVYPLAILVAFFSGFWPYIKLIMMFMIWVLPPRLMSPKSRERMLIVLDTVEKYSLIDSYVLVMMVVSFRYQVGRRTKFVEGEVNEIV